MTITRGLAAFLEERVQVIDAHPASRLVDQHGRTIGDATPRGRDAAYDRYLALEIARKSRELKKDIELALVSRPAIIVVTK